MDPTQTQINVVYDKCQQQIQKIKDYLREKIQKRDKSILQTVATECKKQHKLYVLDILPRISCRKTIQNHFAKIYTLSWNSNQTNYLLTGSQDGRLVVTDVHNKKKVFSIPLRSAYVMTCAFSPSGKYIVSGGLDNLCGLFDISEAKKFTFQNSNPIDLQFHEGYISCIRFIDDDNLISASGDATCILWDINKQIPKTIYNGHAGDVECISIHKEKSIFVSGSIDATAKIWDYRMGNKCINTFKGHTTDINTVQWFPDKSATTFGTGSDDSKLHLYDMRSQGQLNEYGNANIYSSVTSCDFSKSGYYIFAGYDDDRYCIAFNVMTGNIEHEMNHSSRVSCLQTSHDGYQIATGCWDRKTRIWA